MHRTCVEKFVVSDIHSEALLKRTSSSCRFRLVCARPSKPSVAQKEDTAAVKTRQKGDDEEILFLRKILEIDCRKIWIPAFSIPTTTLSK